MTQMTQARFGCDIDEFVESVKESMTFHQSGGLEMVLMSLMSDAQELMYQGDEDEARQTLNRAKYLISLRQEGEL